MLVGMFHYESILGWVEGFSIIAATVILIALASANDYMKDRQFLNLLKKVKDEEVTVLRGKFGLTQTINVFDLVVGDIILLETGKRVPADCVLVEGTDLAVDERYYHARNFRDIKKKAVCTEENQGEKPDPFLYTQTLIESGSGKAVVCAVGIHSKRGEDKAKGLEDNMQQTPLQEKLDNVGS